MLLMQVFFLCIKSCYRHQFEGNDDVKSMYQYRRSARGISNLNNLSDLTIVDALNSDHRPVQLGSSGVRSDLGKTAQYNHTKTLITTITDSIFHNSWIFQDKLTRSLTMSDTLEFLLIFILFILGPKNQSELVAGR